MLILAIILTNPTYVKLQMPDGQTVRRSSPDVMLKWKQENTNPQTFFRSWLSKERRSVVMVRQIDGEWWHIEDHDTCIVDLHEFNEISKVYDPNVHRCWSEQGIE
jgi:hypothetical protein